MTRLDNSKSFLLKFLDERYDWLRWTANLLGVYEVFGSNTLFASKVVCGVLPDLCKTVEGFLITQKPELDDPDRF
jgi:hypothetical protein